MATGPWHYREAERLAEQAGTWMNADTGWKAGLSAEERLAYRMADLTEALVHAQLAGAASTALNDNDPQGTGMNGDDFAEWRKVAANGKTSPDAG